MGAAIINLLPVPPLDGYRIAMQSLEAVRQGRPVNPQVERAMTLSGLAVILMAGIYLIISDIIHLLG